MLKYINSIICVWERVWKWQFGPRLRFGSQVLRFVNFVFVNGSRRYRIPNATVNLRLAITIRKLKDA